MSCEIYNCTYLIYDYIQSFQCGLISMLTVNTCHTMYLILGNCHIIVPLPFQTSWTLALVIFVIYEIEELVH